MLPFGQVTASVPERGERPGEAEREHRLLVLDGPAQCYPRIVVLAFQTIEPRSLLGPSEAGFGRLSDRQTMVGVSFAHEVSFAARFKTFESILADRLKHVETR